MTKTLLITTVAAFGLAGAAMAEDFSAVDADSNGLVSLAEVQAIAPDVTEDEFTSYDGNADGSLDADEYAIWEAATGEEQPSE